jgi:hypothetical protein
LPGAGLSFPGRGLDGVDYLDVAGAAAEISRQRFGNGLAIRIGILSQQRFARQDHARNAEAALHSALLDEMTLQVGGAAAFVMNALDGENGATIGLRSQQLAAIHQHPIQQDGASAAFAYIAAIFDAGDAKMFAQEREQ